MSFVYLFDVFFSSQILPLNKGSSEHSHQLDYRSKYRWVKTSLNIGGLFDGKQGEFSSTLVIISRRCSATSIS
jgi:hypothetical protein